MTFLLKKEIFSGLVWSISGQIGCLVVSLISNIILARILSPLEFGKIGIVIFFISVANVISESGLNGALVRNNYANDNDFSTIFIFNIFISIILCLILISFSGHISDFYNDKSLKNLIIVSSFILIINGLRFVQSTKLVKQMRFKLKVTLEFLSILFASVVSIILAINNYGVWALVSLHLLNALILTLLIWISEGGNGKLIFSVDSFKFHYKYGVNTTIASVMSSLFDNIYQIIFAKYFSFSQTGLYYQAKKIQEIPFGVINNLTQSVLFSGYSKIQGDEKNFFEGYNKLFRFFTIALSFISIILFFFSKEIIILILGFKWIGSIFFLKSLSIVGFFYVQEMLIRMLFKIFNNTVYILKLELIKKIIQIVSIFFGLFYGSIYILIYGLIISNIISFLIYYYIANKKYPFLKLNKNKYLLKGCFVMIITFVFTHFSISMFFIDSFLIKLLLVVFLFFITTLILGLIDLKNDFTFLKKIYG